MTPRIHTVEIRNHPRLPDHRISLGEHRHLVLTGPNGSRKTTVLNAMVAAALDDIGSGLEFENLPMDDPFAAFAALAGPDEERTNDKTHAHIIWSQELPSALAMVLAHHTANRTAEFEVPKGPKDFRVDPTRRRHTFASEFLQLLVNRHTSMLLRRARGDSGADSIAAEIEELRDGLRHLFAEPTLAFELDADAFKIEILIDGRSLYFPALAAGHGALLQLVGDLYTRLTASGLSRQSPGVVFIDEPELHLHPALQERVLPGLTTLFPSLQFIVATHCAPVISSIPDAWVHDLRDQTGISSSELQGRPYGSILRSHFRVPTDYDRATTERVEAALERAGRANDRPAKETVRTELEALLGTDDTRVLDMYTKLSLELA